jgi:hypothetical protein
LEMRFSVHTEVRGRGKCRVLTCDQQRR